MKLFNTYYENFGKFKEFIELHDIQRTQYSSCLIHIYSGVPNHKLLKRISSEILSIFPRAQIIGATTAGEIMEGNISSNKIAISINLFEKTQVKTFSFKNIEEREEEIVKELLSVYDTSKIRGILALGNVGKLNSETMLDAFSKLCPTIPVFGGNAGDNLQFKNQYIIQNQTISEDIYAFAVFESDDLVIKTEYSLNWKPIGKLLTITKASGNIVYEIDDQPASQVVTRYLGEDAIENLHVTDIEFPLILVRNNIQIARGMTRANPDGSLTFASAIKEGEQFQFSYGDVENIINQSNQLTASLQNQSIEGIYVYSCISRRCYLQDATQSEIEPLQNIASNVGFFTYGEFFHQNYKCEYLNETMTLVTLSENIQSKSESEMPLWEPTVTSDYVKKRHINVQKALSHLITEVTNDLENKNRQIEECNQSILDSIRYAQQIQNAILDSPCSIQEILPHNFVLFKPKYMVSGDFYWFKKVTVSNRCYKLFTVVDCTGHGVPGAFMSMLGTSFLNEIVSGFYNKFDVAHVLNSMREKVKTHLHQDSVEMHVKDGMDMALCAIDYDEMKLHYAGANNPLYIIRNIGGKPANEIEEIRGDRMPVGIHTEEKESFTKHERDIKKGDLLYVFSDGFIDQFGGEKDEKFKKRRFRELLVSVAPLPLNEQKEVLEKTLNGWMGNEREQIDDVTVVGVRV